MNIILYIGAVVGSVNYLDSFSIGRIKRNSKKDKMVKKDAWNKSNLKLAKKTRSLHLVNAAGGM